ncbi:hypothetical protein ACWLZS_000906 [Vibrio parahaemolyticus]|nr:hypothetical protein [Vibrio parahaemolyticus]
MESVISWIRSADGVFYIVNGLLFSFIFFGLAIAGFIHYLDKKEEKEAQLKKRSKNRYHSQHKSNSEHHV